MYLYMLLAGIAFYSTAASAEPKEGEFAPLTNQIACHDEAEARSLIDALNENEPVFERRLKEIKKASPNEVAECMILSFTPKVEKKLPVTKPVVTFRGKIYRVSLLLVSFNIEGTISSLYVIYATQLPGRAAELSPLYQKRAIFI